jgi:hypothetical protein
MQLIDLGAVRKPLLRPNLQPNDGSTIGYQCERNRVAPANRDDLTTCRSHGLPKGPTRWSQEHIST